MLNGQCNPIESSNFFNVAVENAGTSSSSNKLEIQLQSGWVWGLNNARQTTNTVNPSTRLENVITSYSIHYTKLYDSGCELISVAPLLVYFRMRRKTDSNLERSIAQHLHDVTVEIKHRITSYNVCYTKLLRSPRL